MEKKKSPLKSKTLWVNFLMAAMALFGLNEKFPMSSDQLVMFMAFVNMVLRMVTKDKLGLEE